jgi:ATP-binding cassette, subfamily B, bacterial HlyB/CyaB
MAAICQDRTVIIIGHRLSSVRGASRIVVMEQGWIVEQGTHDVLLGHAKGLYARLWAMQSGSATTGSGGGAKQ